MSRKRKSRNKAQRRRRGALEALEPRQLLAVDFYDTSDATLLVTTLVDELDANPAANLQHLSLREALSLANATPHHDIIKFSSELFHGPPIHITIDPDLIEEFESALVVDSSVSLVGPGPSMLTISGDYQSQVLHLTERADATIVGMSIVEGTSRFGGGIFLDGGRLILHDVTVADNHAAAEGGGIYVEQGYLGLHHSLVFDNSAGTAGAGLRNRRGQLHIDTTTFERNTLLGSSTFGAGLASDAAGQTITIDGSLFANNKAQGANSTGGGLAIRQLDDRPDFVALHITNSTFSGNSANSGGGLHIAGVAAELSHITVADNQAAEGGGIAAEISATVTLTNSLVATNTSFLSGQPDDLRGTFSATSHHNLIGFDSVLGNGLDDDRGDGQANRVGGELSTDPLDARIAPLGHYGGPTRAHALRDDSIAIDMALATAGLLIDQRGQSRSGSLHTGQTLLPDAGAYEATRALLAVDNVSDVVDDELGPGELGLREAIALAKLLDGPDTISFDLPFAGNDASSSVIYLQPQRNASSPALFIDSDMAIVGPGRTTLRIDGGYQSSLVDITTDITVTLSNLTLTSGSTHDNGGGIVNRGALTLQNVAITDSEASQYGGAIYHAGASLVISSTEISNSRATLGGGVYVADESIVTELHSSTLWGNDADDGGGLYAILSDVELTNVTLSGNTANRGAGVFSHDSTVKFTNATITNNTAAIGGAGIFTDGGTLLYNSIVSANVIHPVGAPSNIAGTVNSRSSNNIIGSNGNGGLASGGTRNNHVDIDNLSLTPLGYYGGNLPVHFPRSGSLASDAGQNSFAAGIPFDGRGEGYARQLGASVDIGAVEAGRLVVNRFHANGTELFVTYTIHSSTLSDAPIELGIYRTNSESINGTGPHVFMPEGGGSWLMYQLELAPGDLSPGEHTIGFRPLFDNDADDDYQLSVRIVDDSAHYLPESWQVFEGGVFQELDGTLHVHGGAQDDQVAISEELVQLNEQSDVRIWERPDTIYVRTHDGRDSVDVNLTSGTNTPHHVLVWTGDNNDVVTLVAPEADVSTGDGSDTLLIHAQSAHIDGGSGNDTYAFSPELQGRYFIADDEGTDTLDFAQVASHGVNVDLGSTLLATTVAPSDFELYLSFGQLENVFGTRQDDILRGNSVSNTLDGGEGNDVVFGGLDIDKLMGGPGDDVFDLGPDRDIVTGDAGWDDAEIIDQRDAGFRIVAGDWWEANDGGSMNAAQYLASFAAATLPVAEWTFDNLESGQYEVSATWLAAPTTGGTVGYQVNALSPATVDQRLAPIGPTLAGVEWQPIAIASPVNGRVTVTLRPTADGELIYADAIRLARIDELPQWQSHPDVSLDNNVPFGTTLHIEYPSGDLEALQFELQSTSIGPWTIHASDEVPGEMLLQWAPTTADRDTIVPVKVTATDSRYPARTAIVEFTVTVGHPNDLPVVSVPQQWTVVAGQHLSFAINATDPDSPNESPRLSLDVPDATATSSLLWASIDSSTGGFHWSPTDPDIGIHSFTLRAWDNEVANQFTSMSIVVHVVPPNDMPGLTATAGISTPEDTPLSFYHNSNTSLRLLGGSDELAVLQLALHSYGGLISAAPGPLVNLISPQLASSHDWLVRGTRSQLDQFLNGVTFHPDPNFHGTAHVRLEASRSPLHNPVEDIVLLTVPIEVTPVDDPPIFLSESFPLNPVQASYNEGSFRDPRVGQLLLENVDRLQTVTWTIVNGNSDGAFSIDAITGEILVRDPTQLLLGTTRDLTIKATDDTAQQLAATGVATIIVKNVANQPPLAGARYYTLSEGDGISGNIFLDANSGIAPTDPDGDPLVVQSVSLLQSDGSLLALPLGINTSLPSQATMQMSRDGSFSFDSSLSPSLGDLVNSSAFLEFYVVVDDRRGGSITTNLIVEVLPVNDPPQMADQVLHVPSTASFGTFVGRILVTNNESSDLLSYSLLTPTSEFLLDTFSGELFVNDPAALSTTVPISLVVEASDSLGQQTSANVTIYANDVAPLRVPVIQPTTNEDLPLIDNVFSLDTGSGSLQAWNGGRLLRVVAVEGSHEQVGHTLRLPSGATYRVDADGALIYDPRPSTSHDELGRNAIDGSTQRDMISMTVADQWGTQSDLLLAFDILGRNDVPHPKHLTYKVASDRFLRGNLVGDQRTMHLGDDADRDDTVRVVAVNGINVQTSLSFTTPLGASVTVAEDGSFTYNPTVPLKNLFPGDIARDTFLYQISDNSIEGPTTALAEFHLSGELSSSFSSVQVEDLRLLLDDGVNDWDRRSTQPQLTGTIGGVLQGIANVRVEFDWSVDVTNDAEFFSVDSSLAIPITGGAVTDFTIDPRQSVAFDALPGEKWIAYRAIGEDTAGTDVSTALWQLFRFDLLSPVDYGPLFIDRLRLLDDTGDAAVLAPINSDTVNGNSTSQEDPEPTSPFGGDGTDGSSSHPRSDRITTNPTITGTIVGDFSNNSVVVQFKHQRSGGGIISHRITIADSNREFVYDPRTADPSLIHDPGPLTINVELIAVQTSGTETVADQIAFQLELIQPPASDATVTGLVVLDPSGKDFSDARTIAGTATVQLEPGINDVFVELDYEANGRSIDELVDHTIQVLRNDKGGFTFEHRLVGASIGGAQVQARVRHWSVVHSAYVNGPWSNLLSLPPLVGRSIVEMTASADELGRMVFDGQIDGAIAIDAEDPTGATQPTATDDDPFASEDVGFVRIEFFHGPVVSNDQDPDGIVWTDRFGNFQYVAAGLPWESALTVSARTVRYDVGDPRPIYGELRELQVSTPAPPLPPLISLELISAPLAIDSGRMVTDDPRLQGQLEMDSVVGLDPAGVRVEVIIDAADDPADDELVRRIVMPHPDGQFAFDAYGFVGDVSVLVRIVHFDPLSGTATAGPWLESHRVDLTILAAPNEQAYVTSLIVVDGSLAEDGNWHSLTAAFDGTVVNPDGDVAGLTVRLRDGTTGIVLGSTTTDALGEFTLPLSPWPDNSSPIAVETRVEEWDYGARQFAIGPWLAPTPSLSFVLDSPDTLRMGTLRLHSDTGVNHDDRVTANPTVIGRVDTGIDTDSIAIEVEHSLFGPFDNIPDAVVVPEDDGRFLYSPAVRAAGTYTLRARVVGTNEITGQPIVTSWSQINYTVEDQPNIPPIVSTLQIGGNSMTTGSTTSGLTEYYEAGIAGTVSSPLALSDVAIHVDYDDDDSNGWNVSTTTDEWGDFAATLPGLPVGDNRIRVRARLWDSATASFRTSGWTDSESFAIVDDAVLAPRIEYLDVSVLTQPTSPPTTNVPQLQGSVSTLAPPNTPVEIVVADGIDANVLTTVSTLAGAFSINLDLMPGEHTIWARPRIRNPHDTTQYLYGPWHSITFQVVTDAPDGFYVSQLMLLHDTHSDNGSTDHDGSTSDPQITGMLSHGTGQSVANIVLEIDHDLDDSADGVITTSSTGQFTYDPGLFRSTLSPTRRSSVSDPDSREWFRRNLDR
ncbi:MAG: hypothetical protein KDA99_08210 [Planctomycetales bacterium]|nr:hypothetical protein [Planctomycetales bacterium]